MTTRNRWTFDQTSGSLTSSNYLFSDSGNFSISGNSITAFSNASPPKYGTGFLYSGYNSSSTIYCALNIGTNLATSSLVFPSTATVYFDCYFYISGLSSAQAGFMPFSDFYFSHQGPVITGGRGIGLVNASGIFPSGATAAETIPLNEWFRVQCVVVNGNLRGSNIKVYTGVNINSDTPAFTAPGTTDLTVSSAYTALFVNRSFSGTSSQTIWMDDLIISRTPISRVGYDSTPYVSYGPSIKRGI